MNALYTQGNRHFDYHSKLSFSPILVGGVFLGIANDITEEQAKLLEGREHFKLLDNAELAALLAEENAPVESSGDPITDAADVSALSYQDLLKLAKARGLKFDKQPSKPELLAALTADPLGDAPTPPGSTE